VESSAFAPVLQVLRALKAHDPYRAPFFAKILAEQGKRPHKKGEGIDEILQVSIGKELDRALAKRLEQAVQLRAVEVSADTFEKWFSALQAFMNRTGHTLVPSDHVEQNLRLGGWVNKVRSRKLQLNQQQVARLHSVAFVWSVPALHLQEAMRHLRIYYKREGHLLVPSQWIEDKFKLGSWVGGVRSKRNLLTHELREELDRMGFSWDTKAELFDRNLRRLERFYEANGHSEVPQSYRDDVGVLGSVVSRIRAAKPKLDHATLKRLAAIQFSWAPRQSRLDQQISTLESFAKREGHTSVPSNTTENGVRLDKFITHLRGGKYKLSQQERLRIEATGFSWNPYEQQLRSHLAAFEQFVTTYGHARVTNKFVLNNLKLGRWVEHVRRGEIQVPHDVLDRLNSLGFIWNVYEHNFNVAYRALEVFKEAHGHLKVPKSFVVDDINLGVWLSNIKRRGCSLKEQSRLKALGVNVSLKKS
jgi:hypothetical protein